MLRYRGRGVHANGISSNKTVKQTVARGYGAAGQFRENDGVGDFLYKRC